MAAFKYFVMLVLMVVLDFVKLEQCIGYNLNSCDCEDDYMVCRWVSFEKMVPSIDSTRTKVLFVNKVGDLQHRRYNPAVWPNLKYVSTKTSKYLCAHGYCSEISNFQTTSFTSEPNNSNKELVTPLMKDSSNLSTDISVHHQLTRITTTPFIEPTNGINPMLTREINTSRGPLINHSISSRTGELVHQTHRISKGLSPTPTPSSRSDLVLTHDPKYLNLNLNFTMVNSTQMGLIHCSSNYWKLAFILCFVVFVITTSILSFISHKFYRFYKKRPYNLIFDNSQEMEHWDAAAVL